MNHLLEEANHILPELIEIRRALHKHPEIGLKEYWTTQFITEKLKDLNIDILPWGGETGVVGLLKGAKPGPVVAIRADIDALPIEEENDVSYRSENKGVMHACGHDVHATYALGAAMLLAKHRESLAGSVKFIFQPAEELNVAAKQMIANGVLENPKVDAIFGAHNMPQMPVGQIGLKPGPLMAATETIFITVNGKSGHGAMPHMAHDTVVAAAAIIQGLQTLVSRQVDPLQAAVVSICSIHAGHAYNVIPDKLEMLGTVRTFDARLREEMPKKMQKLVENTATAYGCTAELNYRKDIPAVDNPGELVDYCRNALLKLFDKDSIIAPTPAMGGEDFAYYQQKVPGVFLWIGSGNEAKGIVNGWHHPRFDVDENTLQYGAAAFAQLAMQCASK